MNEKNKWGWIIGAVVVIVLLLVGFWLWGNSNSSEVENTPGYGAASTTGDALQGVGAPVPPVAEETRTSSTVQGIIASLSNESRFAGLLSSTGVAGLVGGKGPYTIFVPTNAAFGLLPAGSLNLSSAGLKRLIEYHIVSGKTIDVNAQTSASITALSGDALNFSVLAGDKSARINSSVALRAYKASNGIVYVVSEVLLPPYDALK